MSELPRTTLAMRCNKWWRVIGTGLSFLTFGVGGVLLGVLAFPLIDLFILDRIVRRRWSRRLVQMSFSFHFELMRRLGVLSYEVRGRERLQRDGLLILANHPTLIDVVLLVSLLPNADCVVKSSLARNLFTRGPVRAAGYVSNDDSVGLIDDCIAAVRRGGNLVIFPEGTRSPRGGRLRLQRGAANIAIRGQLNITPVRLSCSPMTLGKGDAWYNVPLRRFHIVAEVGPDIEIDRYLDDARGAALAARRLTDDLTYFFENGTLRANS